MDVALRAERDGYHGSLRPVGPFDIAHASAAMAAIADAEPRLQGCRDVDVDLAEIDHIDGTGAVLLARLLDRLNSEGRHARIVEGHNPGAARLIARYRSNRTPGPPRPPGAGGLLAQLGAAGAALPSAARHALDFTGHCAASVPKAIAKPASVYWGSLPRLVQSIGADALVVTSAANLLIGVIIGFLGVAQLGRFGAVAYVPELVVVAHFRELGALVTAIIVAGRSGAGLASELATMKVSEEIDALKSMGFDPVRWLVVPRCLALVLVVPLLTWIGDAVALVGGFLATMAVSDLPPQTYIAATEKAITGAHLVTGLVKSPFLALAIGLVSCGQGLAAHGGAAAVGARTTTAVVLSIFSVIVINALFTLLFAILGI